MVKKPIDDFEEEIEEEIEIDEDTDEDDSIEIEEEITPKKKGRPQSDYYVKESDLRLEIEISQKNRVLAMEKFEKLWQDKIDSVATEPEKEAVRQEKTEAFSTANTKTHCTDRLGEIVVLTVDRVATQTKFRRYTYLDDMKAEAIYQSIKGITKFDLTKTNDAGQKSSSFSYLTQIITNAFRQILKKEKKNREIKDQAIELALNEHSDIDVDFESIKRKRERMEINN